MRKHICAAAVILACGQSVALGQDDEGFDRSDSSCSLSTTGDVVILASFPDGLSLCPSVAVASGTTDANRMVFGWSSATLQVHRGLGFAGEVVPYLPATNGPASQIFVQRFYPNSSAYDPSPQPLVYYAAPGRAWGHQYPSIAAQRMVPCEPPPATATFALVMPEALALPPEIPEHPPEVAGSSNVVATLASDFSGFSKVSPSPDSRVIYVSESGSDSQTLPYSPNRPLRTLTAAYALVRDNQPDQVLLKRGDEFELTTRIEWNKGGRSPAEPSLLGTYGPTQVRPVIDIADHIYGFECHRDAPHFWTVLGVELQSSEYDGQGSLGPPNEPVGIKNLTRGSLWIEDCKFHLLGSGVESQVYGLHGAPNPRSGDVFRRNIFWNITRAGPSQGGSGLFQAHYHRSIVEENFLGLHASMPQAQKYCSQGVYNSPSALTTDAQVVRDNLTYNIGKSGLSLRSGGLGERNVVIRASTGISIGHCDENQGEPPTWDDDGTLRQNLVIESIDFQDVPGYGGWAFSTGPLQDGFFQENIATQGTGANSRRAFQFVECTPFFPVRTLVMSNNIAYEWRNTGFTDATLNLDGQLREEASVTFLGNRLLQTGDTRLVMSHDFQLPAFENFVRRDEWEDGQYTSGRSDAAGWFQAAQGPISKNLWKNGNLPAVQPVDEDASYTPTAPSDPTRTVGSYVTSIGQSPATSGRFADLLAGRGLGVWNLGLTARGLLNYIRVGFDLPSLPHDARPDPGPGAGTCPSSMASLFRVFSMNTAPASVPQVSDTNTAYGCGEGISSVAYSNTYFLRVGVAPDQSRVWFGYNFQSDSQLGTLRTLPSNIRATAPCVSAASCNYFVAVWIEYDLSASPGTASKLMCARFHPGQSGAPQVHELRTGLNVQPHEHRHGETGWPRVNHGAWDWVVPPSVACMDDSSFVVSYCDGQYRKISTYTWSASGLPATPRHIIMDSGGFVRFNHCVVAKGPSVFDASAVIAFVGMLKPGDREWAPYFRLYMPNGYTCQPGRPYKIPTDPRHPDNLCLGPAFAHPAAIRPDGKLVVTWWRHANETGTPGGGTVLGFSVVDTQDKYCPTDLNCNGTPGDANDVSLYQTILNNYPAVPDPRADWDCNGFNPGAEMIAFQNTTNNVGCRP